MNSLYFNGISDFSQMLFTNSITDVCIERTYAVPSINTLKKRILET